MVTFLIPSSTKGWREPWCSDFIVCFITVCRGFNGVSGQHCWDFSQHSFGNHRLGLQESESCCVRRNKPQIFANLCSFVCSLHAETQTAPTWGFGISGSQSASWNTLLCWSMCPSVTETIVCVRVVCCLWPCVCLRPQGLIGGLTDIFTKPISGTCACACGCGTIELCVRSSRCKHGRSQRVFPRFGERCAFYLDQAHAWHCWLGVFHIGRREKVSDLKYPCLLLFYHSVCVCVFVCVSLAGNGSSFADDDPEQQAVRLPRLVHPNMVRNCVRSACLA